MEWKIKLHIVFYLMVFSVISLLSSCILFDDALTEDWHGNKIVIRNYTSHPLVWYRQRGKVEKEIDNPIDRIIAIGDIFEVEEKTPTEKMLQERIKDTFKLTVSNGTKTLDYTDMELQSFPDSIHSITNLNSWEKDFYVYEGDTFDILRFTFTDKDFE